MKAIIISVLLAATTVASAKTQNKTAALDPQLKTQLQQEIDYIGTLYGTDYAPRFWKQKHLGWDLPAQIALAQTKLAAAQNMHQAREAVAGLIRSTADYHVSYSFYSTEKATLPFQVRTVEGKTLIVAIDRDKLSKTAFPFVEGDEVLTIDQVPVAQTLQEIITMMGPNVPGTDLALADMYLTRRSGKLNFAVPHGPVTLSIKRAADDSVGSVQLTWDYSPEQLSNGQVPFTLARKTNSLFHRKMISGVARELMVEGEQENVFGLGARKSFLPDFGTRVWQTEDDNTFDAYIYQNAQGQSIGVIRIFAYEVDGFMKAVKDFAGIISKMEKETSALVIDQNNNPGGSVFYLYSLASMLTDQVLTVPQHRVSLLPAEAKECVETLEVLKLVKNDEDAGKVFGTDSEGYPVTYQLAAGTKAYCEAFMSEYHAGHFLTAPLYLQGVDKINPNPVHYTKPVVLLVNQLDFSGGDFFPATLQDNKRATIVGTRTAGAGGFILDAAFPNAFGLENISFTGSIAQRVDKNPIENLGVTPDVSLPMTVDDFRNGFQHYTKGVQGVVDRLIK